MAVTTKTTGRNVEAEYANVKETFPESVAPIGGTVSTGYRKDQIVGAGTSFKDEIEKGDYIWFTTTDELVEVVSVTDDTHLSLKYELAGTLAGVAYKVVKRNSFKIISWLVDDANTAAINGITYPLASSKSYGNDKPNGQGGGDRLAPVLVDTTANGNTVFISGE